MTERENLTELNDLIEAGVEEGRPSLLYEYCKEVQRQGYTECMWICKRHGRRWIAKDLKLEGSQFPIHVHELRKIFSWWKRHSFYSTVGVKEVMIRFLSYDQSKNEIGVVVINFDYDRLQTELNKSIEVNLENKIKSHNCGVSVLGQDYCGSEPCENLVVDDVGSLYCIIQQARKLSLCGENYKFLPAMLEYYWQNGIDKTAVEFLRDSRFVTQYKSLATDSYSDAANPYGKTVYAFMDVEGWHIRYMLLLIMVGVLCSVCVVAVATAVSQSLDIGLTAGSYALGIATLFLAIMTFLSAVL